MVPRAGLEPAQSLDHEILSLARIPISPPRRYSFLIDKKMSLFELLSVPNPFKSLKTLYYFNKLA